MERKIHGGINPYLKKMNYIEFHFYISQRLEIIYIDIYEQGFFIGADLDRKYIPGYTAGI